MRGVCDGENLVSAYACNQVADCYAAAVDTDVACVVCVCVGFTSGPSVLCVLRVLCFVLCARVVLRVL